MAELLLELLSEEIPARMQARAAENLKRLVCDGLKEAGLSFERAEAFVTPRRLALVVDGLPAKQPDVTEERKGPRVGAPEQAIQGFLKSAGLKSLDQCEVREIKGNQFHFAVTEKRGGETLDTVIDTVRAATRSLPWAKSMRWADGVQTYVRPLHRALLCFGDNKTDGAIDFGGNVVVPTDRKTVGHRFLAPKAFAVKNENAPARRKREDKDKDASFLAMYFREMAALDVLKPEEEFEFARRLERAVIVLDGWSLSGRGAMESAPGVVPAQSAAEAVEMAVESAQARRDCTSGSESPPVDP